ncbi:MAG: hypothetical protein M3P38_04335 [Chloroflexota bacterium]|nr:hypothetical protein [Chloroflexota bacterium]
MSGTDRHSVLIDLDRKERGTRLWQRIALIAIGTALAAAALLSQQRSGSEPAPAPTATPRATGALLAPRPQLSALSLPTSVTDVELSAFPDWLANEPPPASLRAVVAIRGTMGIASVEGLTVVNWTELGVSYRLESLSRSVPELVVLADSLR